MHFLQAINSDISVFEVWNKTGGTIKGDIKKIIIHLSTSTLSSVEFLITFTLQRLPVGFSLLR